MPGDSGERAFTLSSVSLAAFLRRLLARSLLPSRNNQSAEQQEGEEGYRVRLSPLGRGNKKSTRRTTRHDPRMHRVVDPERRSAPSS